MTGRQSSAKVAVTVTGVLYFNWDVSVLNVPLCGDIIGFQVDVYHREINVQILGLEVSLLFDIKGTHYHFLCMHYSPQSTVPSPSCDTTGLPFT